MLVLGSLWRRLIFNPLQEPFIAVTYDQHGKLEIIDVKNFRFGKVHL